MPLAAVHVHPESYRVLGVWLSPTRFSYLRTKDGGEARTLGREVMASRGPAPTWDEWVRHLADRTPTVALWLAVPRNDGEEPRHVLARSVAQEAVDRRKRSDQG